MDDLFIDTSAWSLLLRRDRPQHHPVAGRLEQALQDGEEIWTTGLVLQELLQGFPRAATVDAIVERFAAIDLVDPTPADHIQAAEIANRCRRGGVQIRTVDALLAALCVARSLTMLSADQDFDHLARHVPMARWSPGR